MKILAIRGHETRGKEIIEILEMLGGKQGYEICTGSDTGYHWYIKDNGLITCNYSAYKNDCVEYTLEEFLEKFPYKVGDKVQHKGATSCGTIYEIETIHWEDNQVKYTICDLYCKTLKGTVTSKDLQPYKEETMEETIKTITIDDFKANTKEWLIDTLESMSKDDALQTICDLHDELHKPQFPKTYVDCCEVLNIIPTNNLVFSNPNEESEYAYRNLALYNDFNILKACRDAYWVLADDWKPDWEDGTPKYGLIVSGNRVKKQKTEYVQMKFCFPTEEILDSFYENFNEPINECKELL